MSRPELLATGPALASRLSGIQIKLIGGEIPVQYGRRLNAAVERLERDLGRYNALQCAIAHLQSGDPELSLWRSCGRLEADLQKFETAFKRIQSGHREPRTEYEKSLTTLLRISGPCCQAKLFKALTAPGE